MRQQNYKSLYFWKTTTPIYSCDIKIADGKDDSSCGLKLVTEQDEQNPTKLGNKLVHDGILKVFDAQQYVRLLHLDYLRRNRKQIKNVETNMSWCLPSDISQSVCERNPLGWDSLHYYCWVNTELNRALIATYINIIGTVRGHTK